MRRLSDRIFSVLQLTRMALVFTAIADSAAALLIGARWHAGPNDSIAAQIDWLHASIIAAISIGLYGFGMSLNDIIDRRRDRQIAADRPLPSGRIGVTAAHGICAFLALLAIGAGLLLSRISPAGAASLLLLAWTGTLIAFYDFAGKYLVAPGLLTLGLIRFFHSTIPAPQLPLLWHPLLLLNHVAILSTLAYSWEAKRPRLTRIHWWAVLGGLATADAFCIGLVWWRRRLRLGDSFAESLWITPGLLVPVAAVIGFIALAWIIKRRSSDSRVAGKTVMLAGLLWLIVYDAAFVAGYVSLAAAAILFLLLPIAYLSVQMMRWWSQLVLLTQKPEFIRVRE